MKIERIIIGVLLGYIIYDFLKKRNIDLVKEVLSLLKTDVKPIEQKSEELEKRHKKVRKKKKPKEGRKKERVC